jgi:hypothetical protein
MRYALVVLAVLVVGCEEPRAIPVPGGSEAYIYFSGTTGVDGLVFTTPTEQVWAEKPPTRYPYEWDHNVGWMKIEPVDNHGLVFLTPEGPADPASLAGFVITTSAGIFQDIHAYALASAKIGFRDELTGRGVHLFMNAEEGQSRRATVEEGGGYVWAWCDMCR